jgi:type VI secretion system protein ImpM
METVAPGWYGKLPVLGDFAGRRLPSMFVEPWDRWLASGMSVWRESDDEWLEAFLSAPAWRFALGAGVPFDLSPGYAGVLMPSVDRVGRYFPLTVARPRAEQESLIPATWLEGLEALAVSAMDEDWNADRLDAELSALAQEVSDGPPWPAAGHSLWWSGVSGASAATTAFAGLPREAEFVRLLSGRV